MSGRILHDDEIQDLAEATIDEIIGRAGYHDMFVIVADALSADTDDVEDAADRVHSYIRKGYR